MARQPHSEEMIKIILAHEGPLLRFAYLHLKDRGLAEDVVQETFVACLAGAHVPDNYRLRRWLMTTCRNKCLNIIKHHKVVDAHTRDSALNSNPESPSPEENLISKEDCVSLAEAIESLPLESQEVLWLRFDGDLSYQQIAEVVGKTPTNVGYLLCTAIKRLKAMVRKGDKS
ncbi:MAG: sigma-70 family RNA polymerase sigma factor [Bdellovibrionales bacterium]|nr:sigma-70 family RNA polymerase sigma factor [Bdellovibrionales bacterium]MCB0386244.1 sigma-70 family RNA polymerase sigma factor [Bdellovibrionales bacterium]